MLKRLAFALVLLWPIVEAHATDFRWDPGTNGFVAAGTSLFGSTQLSAVTNGSCATSTVVVTQSTFANALFVNLQFQSLGAFTPTAGGFMAIWWDRSIDGGSTYELPFTCSTTQPPFQRAPDAVIPFVASALANGNLVESTGLTLTYPGSAKAVVWQMTGATTSTNNHTITGSPFAVTY
jgi:hypothetical protein